MPKLRNLHFEKTSNAGESYSLQTTLYIKTDGTFWAEVAEELYDSDTVFENARFMKDSKGRRVITSDKADGVMAALSFLIDRYLSCDKTVEKVIAYNQISNYSIWVSDAGELFPVGSAEGKGGHWSGCLHTSNAKEFSVGLSAHVLDKFVYTSKNGHHTRVKYSRSPWIGSHLGPHHNYHDLLKSFGHRLSNSLDVLGQLKLGWKEVPYTEETAKFFYDSLMALAALSMKMEAFFNNEQGLLDSINGTKFLEELNKVESE